MLRPYIPFYKREPRQWMMSPRASTSKLWSLKKLKEWCLITERVFSTNVLDSLDSLTFRFNSQLFPSIPVFMLMLPFFLLGIPLQEAWSPDPKTTDICHWHPTDGSGGFTGTTLTVLWRPFLGSRSTFSGGLWSPQSCSAMSDFRLEQKGDWQCWTFPESWAPWRLQQLQNPPPHHPTPLCPRRLTTEDHAALAYSKTDSSPSLLMTPIGLTDGSLNNLLA